MSDLSNNERLKLVASALEELNADVVYVGGAVIQLYSSDAAAINPMTTYDVDCVVNLTSYKEYRAFASGAPGLLCGGVDATLPPVRHVGRYT